MVLDYENSGNLPFFGVKITWITKSMNIGNHKNTSNPCPLSIKTLYNFMQIIMSIYNVNLKKKT